MSIRLFLKKIYYKYYFNPGIAGIFINPFYFVAKSNYDETVKLSPYITGKVLDVGCGQKPYKHLFRFEEYIGLEIEDSAFPLENKCADMTYDGKNFPFENEHFDSVVSFQVFEHVFNPDQFLFEINRILKKGGNLLLTLPFVWDEHEQPYDFARYSSFGMMDLLERNNFKVLSLKKTFDGLGVVFQVLNCYLYRIIVKKRTPLELMLASFLTAPINITGVIFHHLFPKNNCLYLNNIILAEKI